MDNSLKKELKDIDNRCVDLVENNTREDNSKKPKYLEFTEDSFIITIIKVSNLIQTTYMRYD